MALPASLVWEIRPTNGTTNAGGGYDGNVAGAGTDYSQQDAVQQAYTDLVIDATTNTKITSAAHPFGSSHVGNNIAITSGTGFTTGIYNIRSVASNVATLDRAVGTTSSTGGNGNLGGARSGFSVGTNTVQAALLAGHKAYVKNEAWNESITLSVSGSVTSPIIIEGYDTVRGDLPQPVTGNQPTNDRNSAGVPFTVNAGVGQYIVRSIRARRSSGSGWINNGATGGQIFFVGCRSDTNTSSGWATSSGVSFICFNCLADANGAFGFGSNGSGACSCTGCVATGNTNVGIGGTNSSSGVSAVFSLSYANSSHGFANGDSGGLALTNCTSNANTGASTDGFNNAATTQWNGRVLNCIFSNNGRNGFRQAASEPIFFDYNCYYNNSSGDRVNQVIGAHDSTLDPTFTNAAAGDLSIGTNLKALGWPGVFPGGYATGYMDMGGVQRQEAGGASGIMYRNLMRGNVG